MEIAICIICSIIVSAVTTKILATHYFEVVDGYVKGICDKTKEFVEAIKNEICRH